MARFVTRAWPRPSQIPGLIPPPPPPFPRWMRDKVLCGARTSRGALQPLYGSFPPTLRRFYSSRSPLLSFLKSSLKCDHGKIWCWVTNVLTERTLFTSSLPTCRKNGETNRMCKILGVFGFPQVESWKSLEMGLNDGSLSMNLWMLLLEYLFHFIACNSRWRRGHHFIAHRYRCWLYFGGKTGIVLKFSLHFFLVRFSHLYVGAGLAFIIKQDNLFSCTLLILRWLWLLGVLKRIWKSLQMIFLCNAEREFFSFFFAGTCVRVPRFIRVLLILLLF
jgi:hypothetical protein